MKRSMFGFLALLAAAPVWALGAAPTASMAPILLTEALASVPQLEQELSVEQAVSIALRESPVIRGAVQEEAAAGRVAAAPAEQRPWASVNTFLGAGSAAEKNLAVARAGAAAAEEDYRVALLRYPSGKAINVEALDALTASVRAQNNQVPALFDYRVAQDRLARAAGLLGPAGPLK